MENLNPNFLLISHKMLLACCAWMLLVAGSFNTAIAENEAPATSPEKNEQAQFQSSEVVQKNCLTWLEKKKDKAALKSFEQLAADPYLAQHPLLFVAHTVSLIDESTKKMLAELPRMPEHLIAISLENFQPKIDDSWMEANVRLWLAQQLSQRKLYEEALNELVQLDSELLIDPAMYFFHRSVCEHHLLHKDEGLASLNSLLTECKPLPDRYRMVGELMQQDLAKLKEKSLDEITRKMTDVERRLDLGRAGDKVQFLEKEIVASLDEMIKKLEEQQGSGSGSGSGNGSGKGNQPSGPADDSSVKGSTAPGNVDDKDLGHKDNWGKLPPKDQAKAKQILGTMFPPHYRRAIEAYNRKAAQRNSTK